MSVTKRAIVAIAVAAAILSTPKIAKAASEYQIRSHGTLVIKSADNSQYIEFYSEDIRYLQGELDALFAALPGGGSVSAVSMSYDSDATVQKNPTAQDNSSEEERIVTD